MKINKLYLVLSIIVIAIFARLIPHAPNFTPLLAVALFSGAILSKNKLFYLVPVSALLISDLFLGFSSITPVIYFSLGLIAVLGITLKKAAGNFDRKSIMAITIKSFAAAVIFFIVSNMGVFLLTGMYPISLAGLVECYTLAIPFFRNTLISTMAYSFSLFGLYAAVKSTAKKTSKKKAVSKG